MPLFAPSTPWRPVALATAGFSALYAVAVVFFYCDWLFDVPGADPLVYGDQFAFTQMTVVAFALLYLIVSGVALLRNREQRAYDRALRRKDEIIRRYQEARRDVLGLACEELAASRGLTEREAELLRIFAQGRAAASCSAPTPWRSWPGRWACRPTPSWPRWIATTASAPRVPTRTSAATSSTS